MTTFLRFPNFFTFSWIFRAYYSLTLPIPDFSTSFSRRSLHETSFHEELFKKSLEYNVLALRKNSKAPNHNSLTFQEHVPQDVPLTNDIAKNKVRRRNEQIKVDDQPDSPRRWHIKVQC